MAQEDVLRLRTERRGTEKQYQAILVAEHGVAP